MLIFLSGGGTMGSVSPLLALAQEIKKQQCKTRLIWIGTQGGVEGKVVLDAGLEFISIFAGKWRRYFDWRNIIDPFLLLLGFLQSISLIVRHRPAAIVSAGSFVSVPLVWAGWVCRVPSIIHQQDIRVGLANKLMQPFAKKITVAFESQLKLFPAKKVVWTGNPIREEIVKGDRAAAMKLFHLEEGIPTLLVTGGGTGAEFLNTLVVDAYPSLTKFCQIIHLTGGNKGNPSPCPLPQGERENKEGLSLSCLSLEGRGLAEGGGEGVFTRYHFYEFLTSEMPHALAVADLVICRAGMGTLTELAALGKSAFVIPMPGTHQEENAAFFARHGAVAVFNQSILTPEALVQHVHSLFADAERQQRLSQHIQGLMPPDAAARMAEVVIKMIRG